MKPNLGDVYELEKKQHKHDARIFHNELTKYMNQFIYYSLIIIKNEQFDT